MCFFPQGIHILGIVSNCGAGPISGDSVNRYLLGLCISFERRSLGRIYYSMFGSFPFFKKNNPPAFSFCFPFIDLNSWEYTPPGSYIRGGFSKRNSNSFLLPKATVAEGMDFNPNMKCSSWDSLDLCMTFLHGLLSFLPTSSRLLLY